MCRWRFVVGLGSFHVTPHGPVFWERGTTTYPDDRVHVQDRGGLHLKPCTRDWEARSFDPERGGSLDGQILRGRTIDDAADDVDAILSELVEVLCVCVGVWVCGCVSVCERVCSACCLLRAACCVRG